MKPKYIIICAITLVAGCSGNTNNEEAKNQVSPTVQELHNKVMEYHDEVMPDMGEIYNLQSELRNAADSLPSPQNDELYEYAAHLEAADDAMMSWMRQFNAQLTNIDTTAAIAYYEEQLIKVKEMRDQVVEALENGRAAKSDLLK